jgi:hypothetical protein
LFLQACVIFGAVTIFGAMSWFFTPEEKWLSKEQVLQALYSADQPKMSKN